MPLRLSVVLPTFNRPGSLQSCLAALLHQAADASAYEIIVVDNNSSDSTRDVIAGIADRRVRTVREPRQGLSFARNSGVAAARGDLVAFTDDDVEPEPHWVARIITAFAGHPEVDGLGGPVLPAWEAPPPAWLTRQHWGPLALQDHGDAERTFDAGSPIGLVGANVAFRRRVFDELGMFSPDVQRVKNGIGSTEDHELLARLYDAGGRMLYVPGMRVIARVQTERYRREYHRRWHTGHGSFHARMWRPDMERSRLSVAGVPAHLFRSAAKDFAELLARAVCGRWEDAFAAELRLRFFWGFLKTRLGRRVPAGALPARRREWAR